MSPLDQANWRVQILALIERDLEGKKVFYSNFDGECDVCNEKLKTGEPFVFLGQKERTCLKCIKSIEAVLDVYIDKASEFINKERLGKSKKKFIAFN